jgi:hypothetical protein
MSETPLTPIEPLRPLEFLIGDWESLSPGVNGQTVIRKISYRWIFGGHFLAGESSRTMGASSFEMKLFYLWNPLTQRVNAWTFGSDGSWNQSLVDIGNRTATLHIEGVTAGGESIRLRSILIATDPDSRTEDWQGIEIGGKLQPSPPPIAWKRTQFT